MKMKNLSIIFSLLAIVFFVQCSPKTSEVAKKGQELKTTPDEPVQQESLNADFRKSMPEPGPAPVIEIGSYEQFELDNGLKVIVVENHKLPRVSFSLTVDMGPFKEGEFAGHAEMAGQLLSAGTKSKTKAEIDEAIDFMGATLNTSYRGMYAASLRKHTENLLEIVTDVLLNPSFPEEEFDKIKKQTLSGLASSKDNPNAIASNVSSALRYGKDHPYGEITTETTVENITLQKCREFYKNYFLPNISYLIVVGDITAAEVKPMIMKHFSSWKKQDYKKESFPAPKPPEKRSVDFVNKAGAVQSVIRITYPLDLKPGADDEIKTTVLNTMLGGYFASRLNANLREDKAYTYGAGSSLSSDEEIGHFTAAASVRNEVTDSAIVQFLYELERIRNEKADEDEMNLVKNYLSGSFARSLENPQTVARFALNTIRYGLPDDYYATYLEKLSAVTADDVREMALKYIHPDKAYVIVVGNKDEVAEKLTPFAANKKLNFYDNYGEPIVTNAVIPEGMTAEKVLEDYLTALGGIEKLNSVKSLSTVMSADMQGRKMNIRLHQAENKYANIVDIEGMGEMGKEVYNNGKGLVAQMGQKIPLDDEQIKGMESSSYPFVELKFEELGYKTELTGIENIEGTDAYVIAVESPAGEKKTHYFAMETSLKIRELEVKGAGERTITSISDYSDYKEVDGIMFPHTMTITGMMPMPLKMEVVEIRVNGDIDNSIFSVGD